MTVCNCMKMDVLQFMSIWYHKSKFIDTYKFAITPVNGQIFWPKTKKRPIKCPIFEKKKGRKSKENRISENWELSKGGKFIRIGRIATCSFFHVRGHNNRTCNPNKVATRMSRTPNVTTDASVGSVMTSNVTTTGVGSGSGNESAAKYCATPTVGGGTVGQDGTVGCGSGSNPVVGTSTGPLRRRIKRKMQSTQQSQAGSH